MVRLTNEEKLALVDFHRTHRKWEPARHQQTIVRGSQYLFRVLSYNLLGHVKRTLFPYCSKETLKWHFRRDKLFAEVQAYDADICGFQEMEQYEKFWKDALPSIGYQCLYLTKNTANSNSDGICLAWRPNRFDLIKYISHSFEDVMKFLPDATPNVAIIAAFEDLQSGKTIITATTHLYWHWDYDSLRAVQTQNLFQRIFEWIKAEGFEDAEIIVCGGTYGHSTSSSIF